MTLFLNPLSVFIISFGIVAIILDALLVFIPDLKQAANSYEFAYLYGMVILVVMWSITLLVILLLAHLLGKWLEAKNKELVNFLYLMFSIMLLLLFMPTIRTDDDYTAKFIESTIKQAMMFFVLSLFYHFDVKSLAGLTDTKHEINRKIFMSPPTAISFVISAVIGSALMYSTAEAAAVMDACCAIIIFLCIWAFYIVIKNINATNEAIEAKNDAIQARDEVKTLSVEIMEALAHTIDAKDKYTNGHSVRVAKYSRMIAEKLELPEKTCEDIYYMGLLHDIGKIGIPNEIINKPTRLTDEEYEIIKTHPGIGHGILGEIKSRPDLAMGARWHHERYDGKGYPDCICGDEIPRESRIIAVADTYDAMTSNRSYRKYLPQEVVRAELEKNSGTQFDPEAAAAMIKIMDEDTEYVLHE